jgi:hypothetical protein
MGWCHSEHGKEEVTYAAEGKRLLGSPRHRQKVIIKMCVTSM